MVTHVVTDLVGPFSSFIHVVYVTGTIKQRAVGFPEGLKSVKLSKGNYAYERVGDICYYGFEDRSRVCFVSNVFPEAMETLVIRVQLEGTLQFQSIPPLLPAA